MFLVVTAFCVWLAAVSNGASAQRDAVAAINAMGGYVDYDVPAKRIYGSLKSDTATRRFLRRRLPKDYVDNVISVALVESAHDSDLAYLDPLPTLLMLDLRDTQVTDAGLVHLEPLANLEFLSLDRTRVTGAGLAHLKRLAHLAALSLDGAPITDAGLVHLESLGSLEGLVLDRTRVLGPGLMHLRGLPRLDQVALSETQVNDTALVYLRTLTNLKELWLDDSQVSAAGVAELEKALPGCAVHGTHSFGGD
jgi:hypothetical protein